MDEFDIKTERPNAPVEQSPRKKAEKSQLVHVVFETKTGAFYTFPDLTQEMFTELLQQLDVKSEQIIARNISRVTLVLPLRILQRVSMLEADSYSMDHPTRPRHLHETSELWSAP